MPPLSIAPPPPGMGRAGPELEPDPLSWAQTSPGPLGSTWIPGDPVMAAPIASSWVRLFCSLRLFTESLRSRAAALEGELGGAPLGACPPNPLSQTGIVCTVGAAPHFLSFSLGIFQARGARTPRSSASTRSARSSLARDPGLCFDSTLGDHGTDSPSLASVSSSAKGKAVGPASQGGSEDVT